MIFNQGIQMNTGSGQQLNRLVQQLINSDKPDESQRQQLRQMQRQLVRTNKSSRGVQQPMRRQSNRMGRGGKVRKFQEGGSSRTTQNNHLVSSNGNSVKHCIAGTDIEYTGLTVDIGGKHYTTSNGLLNGNMSKPLDHC